LWACSSAACSSLQHARSQGRRQPPGAAASAPRARAGSSPGWSTRCSGCRGARSRASACCRRRACTRRAVAGARHGVQGARTDAAVSHTTAQRVCRFDANVNLRRNDCKCTYIQVWRGLRGFCTGAISGKQARRVGSVHAGCPDHRASCVDAMLANAKGRNSFRRHRRPWRCRRAGREPCHARGRVVKRALCAAGAKRGGRPGQPVLCGARAGAPAGAVRRHPAAQGQGARRGRRARYAGTDAPRAGARRAPRRRGPASSPLVA